MKKILSVLVVFLTLCGMQARAQEESDKVVIQSATIAAGQEFFLPIELVDELTYKAFQMEIVLPEGITPVYVENEDEELELAIERGRLHSTHGITENFRAEEHILGLVCVSTSSKNFRNVEGPLFSVKLKADENLAGGDYTISLTKIKFTSSENNGYDFADASATFTIPSVHTYKFMNGEEVLDSGEKLPGDELTAPENPEKIGYTFDGWSPEFTGTMPDADVTYTATWKAINYQITYILNDGAFAEGYPTTYTIEDNDITLGNPVKEGYTFAGWTTGEQTDPFAVVTIAKGSTGDRTYTATWTPIEYSIEYDLDGGSLAEGVTNPAKYTIESDVIILNNPVKTGYDFAGWLVGDQTEPNMTVTITQGSMGDFAFKATWTVKKFKVTWVVDDASTEDEVEYGATITKPETPTKEGYTFAKWTPDVAETMPAEDVTYTAQWTINTYWVTFMAEETVVSKTQLEFNADIIAPETPELPGKRFIKWDPEVDAKVPAHDVTYNAIYALVVRDTIYVDVEVHDTTYIDVEIHDTIVVCDTIRVSTLQRVDAPFINVTTDGKIELTCEQKDAVIYYTIDGTDPTEASQLYSEPFTVADKTVIKAIAVLRSEVSLFQLQTGVKNARMEDSGGKAYNLQGRQVSKATRGVFIQNGKKVIMK
jgi:uncharacterized repeat protein (TIGR02543 family)